MKETLFYKMHGLGNDFMIVVEDHPPTLTASVIADLACRHTGVGFDQLLWVDTQVSPVRMHVFNADGSHADFCGNGLRCVADHWLKSQALSSAHIQVGAHSYAVSRHAEGVTVTLPWPELIHSAIDAKQRAFWQALLPEDALSSAFLDVGNAHAVVLMREMPKMPADQVADWQKKLPWLQRFNVSFIVPRGGKTLRLQVVERGVGETRACGSASTAAAAWWMQQQAIDQVRVCMRGGDLQFARQGEFEITMTGPATPVFRGYIAL